jgi:DNA-nicking Smr family endonuclease
MPNAPDSFDDLMDEFSSPEAIQEALHEKEAGDDSGDQPIGERVKDYPLPQRTYDCHGMTGPEAVFKVDHWVRSAIHNRLRTIQIITGKGLHSANQEAVLPKAVGEKLLTLKQEGLVLTFKRNRDGGGFVVYLVS